MLKMSDTQLSMLQAAAARGDRFVQPSANVHRPNLKAFVGKLVDAGWAKEIKTSNGALILRRSAESGEAFALKLTAKGVKAFTAKREADGDDAGSPEAAGAKKPPTKSRASRSAPPTRSKSADLAANAPTVGSAATIRAPRSASKLARVLEMLTAQEGATIADLTKETGWLEHTTRAALTGLRRRGYALALAKKERNGASVYRIIASASGPAK